MTSYDLGDVARVTGTWTDSGGTATDPGTIAFTYTDPNGTDTTLTYVTDAAVVRLSTGVYYVDVTANLEGTWFWRWVSTVSGAAADEGQFAVTRTTIRAGMASLINRVRALANAGTAQYAIGDQTYWSDEHIQEKLDSSAVWVVEDPLTWISQNIGGTATYLTAASKYKDFEEATSGTAQWIVRDSVGTENGTTNYSVDYRNGRVTWTADQGGTAYEATGYSYDVHAAAVDILEEKLADVDLWYDFRADNQTFKRSQVIKNMEGNINRLLKKVGENLPGGQFGFHTTAFVRSDLQ